MLTGLKHTEDFTLPILVSDLKRFPLPLDRIDLTHFFHFWYWPSCLDFKNNLSHKKKQEGYLTILQRHYPRTNHWLCSPRETVLINMESCLPRFEFSAITSLGSRTTHMARSVSQLTTAKLSLPMHCYQITAEELHTANSPHAARGRVEWVDKRVGKWWAEHIAATTGGFPLEGIYMYTEWSKIF